MTRSISPPRRVLASIAAALALFGWSATAAAQATPIPESVSVGAWTFRPLLEVRIRGEFRHNPFDVGGDAYTTSSVFGESYESTLPSSSGRQPQVQNQYFVTERARLGIAVDRGPVTALVSLQDARVWGDTSVSPLVAPGELTPGVFAPNEAYLDIHTKSGRRIFFRVGRQMVMWGDGRLVGANDWSATGRSLDAARFGFQAGDFDVEAMAVLLATPGRYLPTAATNPNDYAEGSGAELYGANAVWHLLPLFQPEVTGLARVVRDPVPTTLTPSNTFVADARIAGDRRGFRYAVEGAYEGGQVASYGSNRSISAFALGATASLETSIPGHMTFGAEAAYASGDDGKPTGTMKRFDPLLPDEHTLLSPMSLVAWSNVIVGGGSIGAHPVEEVGLLASYHYEALAQPGGRWSDAELFPIGAAVANTSRSLGHEIDGSIRISPWRLLEIETGYGLFLRGAGAEAILKAVGRDSPFQHWAYLQLAARVP
jgi:hypothetical protein